MKVLLATPCYGGQLMRGYFHSILKLLQVCSKEGIEVCCSTLGNESLITRGRNYFVARFLADSSYTHLFFVDADISFCVESFVRCVKSGLPIACGAYPKKSLNVERISSLVKDGVTENLLEMAADYAINVTSETREIKRGFLNVLYASTGFMCIERQVITAMVEAFPQYQYRDDVHRWAEGDKTADCFYALFDCIICPESKRYLSEDYCFVNRARKLGFEVWVDLAFVCEHSGTYSFKGAYYEQVKKHIEPTK